MFEKRVLRRIFVPKWKDVSGEWSKRHKEELNDLYFSLIIIRLIKSRRMWWVGHVAHKGESRDVYRDLKRKPDLKIPLRRPTHKWEDNINMDFQEVELGVGESMDGIELAQDRDRWRDDVNAVMNFRVP